MSTPYYTIRKLMTKDHRGSIIDNATGKLVGYVKKVENGYWRARNAEGDSYLYDAKTRREAASLMYNVWANAQGLPLASIL